MGNEHRNRELLYELYVEKGLSQNDIAEELNCSSATVNKWLSKYNIESTEPDRPWQDEDVMAELYVERDEIKWDNRSDNLELMTTTEHRKHHAG